MSDEQTTVLVVDDHAAFRASAERLLSAVGYEVVGTAVDGESALAAVALLAPDVVLLDVQLPDFDGFAVAKRIAAASNNARPIVVLTSSRDRGDFGDLIERSPARGFIAKNDLSSETLAELLA